MMKGKCNCGKKATSEWLFYNSGTAYSLKFCDKHKPKKEEKTVQHIYGKNKNL